MAEGERSETNLRVFNTAKLYAEEILFPLMQAYQKYLRYSNFGTDTLDDSVYETEEIKDIQRYNGLKGMADTLHDLLTTITSTVRIKNNKEEIEQLQKIGETLKSIKAIFQDHKERFFTTGFRHMEAQESLNRVYFEKIKEYITICYANVEMIMTRNKLLFLDSADEYKTDKEIIEDIKKEYIET